MKTIDKIKLRGAGIRLVGQLTLDPIHRLSFVTAMNQSIAGYHKDQEDHWVAQLACGHFQHVRHDPPWMEREWTKTDAGRQSMIGYTLDCVKCDEGAPPDQRIFESEPGSG